MAASAHTQQVAKLRRFLVISYVVLATASMAGAFLLSWYSLPGAPWFLGTTVTLGLWASVTATCHRVAASEFLGIAKIVGQKNIGESRDAA